MNGLKGYIKGTGWAKLIAVMNIVGGALSIPIGILLIIAGIKLWNTANNLENYKNTENEEDLKEALKNLSDYFTWYGWVIALSLAILALVLIAIFMMLEIRAL
jgi:CHASE3 domain sensor protein